MTQETRIFSGEVMASHWSDEEGGVATMAVKRKGAKKKTTRKPRPKATRAGPGCQTGKKTC